MYLVYFGRNLLLIVAEVKEVLCPQHVAGSVPMFTMSISGCGKTNLSSGELGPVTVTVHMNNPEVWEMRWSSFCPRGWKLMDQTCHVHHRASF